MRYIITLQWFGSNGMNVATMSDVVPVNGRTREQLYNHIFGKVTTQHGAPPARTSVLLFSLEPDQIEGAAA
ncbi:hypothetical protein [Nocardia sp. NPDC059239]|uniref:hypothetical protein n=1 Tax=Nocardia sp. NPDC059239 TaxID=3346785 RepID=UPI00368A5533